MKKTELDFEKIKKQREAQLEKKAKKLEANEAEDQPSFAFLRGKFKFKPQAKVEFFKGVSSMLRAQITMSDAIHFYTEGLTDIRLVNKLKIVRASIEKGDSVNHAFKKSELFDDSIISLITAGTQSGNLGSAFDDLAEKTQTDLTLQSRLRNATLIPSIVIPVLIAGAIYSQVNILPKIKEMITSTGVEPEGFIVYFFKTSGWLQLHWPKVALTLLAIASILKFVKPVQKFILRIAIKRIKLVRLLVMSIRQLNIVSSLYLMTSNNIEFSKAMKTAAKGVANTPLEEEIENSITDLNQGLGIGSALGKNCKSLDKKLVHLLKIGEKSANIQGQLALLKDMYKRDSEKYLSDFTNLVSFAILLLAVGLIAVVFIGTFLPVFLMGPQIMNNAA